MKKKKAVFTQIHNEPLFFPLWLKYYSQFFDAEDIYVIHLCKPIHVPFDSWIQDQSGFVRLPYPDLGHCDFQIVVDRAKGFQTQLLEKYETVLFAEVDELLAHKDGLGNYMDGFCGDFVRCTGYNVLHDFNEEPKIDFSKPIMSQRKWWYFDHLYSKAIMSRIPLDWCWGFHNCDQNHGWDQNNGLGGRPSDPDLIMVHLRNMDLSLCTARALERQKNEDDSEYSKRMREGGVGFQHWLNEFEIKAWFNLGFDKRELIPEFAKQFPI